MKKTPVKDPRGRKARGGAPAVSMTIRLTVEERALYDAAAAAEELSLAEWIRAACGARLKSKHR